MYGMATTVSMIVTRDVVDPYIQEKLSTSVVQGSFGFVFRLCFHGLGLKELQFLLTLMSSIRTCIDL